MQSPKDHFVQWYEETLEGEWFTSTMQEIVFLN